MTVSKFLFGTGLENEIRVGFPLYDILTDREDGAGSEYIDVPDGSVDTWRQNKMFTMDTEVRWIPDGPGTNPVQTQLSGPVSWEEFVDWARDGRAFRFQPDETVPDFYVDNTYLVEPRKGFGNLSPDIKRNVRLKLRNPAKSFHEALRGIMFEYAPGASLTDPVAATFTRATAATRRGLPGTLVSAVGASDASGVLRDRHYEGSLRTTLLEAVRTQLVTDPENFGNWTAADCVLTSGQADPFRATAAYLLDTNAVGGAGITQNVAFTGDGTKVVLLFMRAGTAATSQIAIRDTTAGVYRHLVSVTWTAGVPSLSTSTGSGTLFPVIAFGGGWYALAFGINSVVAANTNRFDIYPDVSATGLTVYAFGANAWNAAFPSSYQGPSLGTRNNDDLSWSFPYIPQAMFALVEFVERGSAQSGGGTMVVAINGPAGQAPRIDIEANGSGGYSVQFFNPTQQGSGTPGAVAFRDTVAQLMTLTAAGVAQLRQSLNGGAEVAGSATAGQALPAAWAASTRLHLGRYGGATLIGTNAFARVKIGPLTFGGITRDTIAKALAA